MSLNDLKELIEERKHLNGEIRLMIPRMKQEMKNGKQLPSFVEEEFNELYQRLKVVEVELHLVTQELDKKTLEDLTKQIEQSKDPEIKKRLEKKKQRFEKIIEGRDDGNNNVTTKQSKKRKIKKN